MLAASPGVARHQAGSGAERQTATDHFFPEISHYLYEGDTALHMAAAGGRTGIVAALIAAGADVGARNRRGAEPLHYACDASPGAPHWNPSAHAAVVALLIAAGADPNARDRSGVAPLHRAIRAPCAAAVEALLRGGADAGSPNGRGSTPLKLATANTGRSGSGSPEARAEQAEILERLEAHLAR
ncbi:hypothetical protein BH09PSE1_BH09PSE1_25960 [soil metagenome]